MNRAPSESILGVDIGTGGCKTLAVDSSGKIIAEATVPYPTMAPRPGWAEQDPDLVLEQVSRSIRQCAAELQGPPVALCLSGALHSFLPLDDTGRPLMNALTWADSRAATQAARLKGLPAAHALYDRTGCPLHPLYWLPKALWLRENRPDLLARTARIVSIKDYVVYHLTGEWLADQSIASGTGLLNLETLDWDDGALDAAELCRELLLPVMPITTDGGSIQERAVESTNLPRGTRVVLGACDAALSSLGAGAVGQGTFVAMIGSSGAVRTFSPRPLTDPRERTWCYVLDRHHYLVGGAINNAGLVLRWFADKVLDLHDPNPFELLTREAAEVQAGAEGLLFLPFLTGERSPGWNSRARGVLFGLSLHHGRAHFARAMLESVGLRLRSVLEAMEQVAGPAREIRVSGGFVNSPLWLQIVSDILGRSLFVPSTPNTSALGAALLGWHALGELPELQGAERLVGISSEVAPNPDRHDIYSRLFGLYEKLYRELQGSFEEISDFQEEFSPE